MGGVSLMTRFNSAGNTHVIVDVVGWFTPAFGQLFHPLTPYRIVDSRPGVQYPFRTPWGPGESRSVQVTSFIGAAVPPGAGSGLLNVTATNTTAPGYLTVWPAEGTLLTASNLNWAPGATIAGSVTTKLSSSGPITLTNGPGTVDVLIDVSGWSG